MVPTQLSFQVQPTTSGALSGSNVERLPAKHRVVVQLQQLYQARLSTNSSSLQLDSTRRLYCLRGRGCERGGQYTSASPCGRSSFSELNRFAIRDGMISNAQQVLLFSISYQVEACLRTRFRFEEFAAMFSLGTGPGASSNPWPSHHSWQRLSMALWNSRWEYVSFD